MADGYANWTEAMLFNVGAIASPEEVALALRLIALVNSGWSVERLPDRHVLRKGGVMVESPYLREAIAAAEACEAEAKEVGDGQ